MKANSQETEAKRPPPEVRPAEATIKVPDAVKTGSRSGGKRTQCK